MERRKDSHGVVLKENESERKDGSYQFRWRSRDGNRHTMYAKTLEELRRKEAELAKDKSDSIRTEGKNYSVNDMAEIFFRTKRGLRDTTASNYRYMYDQFVRSGFGEFRLTSVKKSDVKKFYNTLVDEKGLKANTVDSIHTVLRQVFQLAVDDDYIRKNPTEKALAELKKSHPSKDEKRMALTRAQQDLFLNFLMNHNRYYHWYPIFALMLGTGLRVGEATGLTWDDIDFDKNTIDVNHNLVFYAHRLNDSSRCYFNVHPPKTKASIRVIPMSDFVKDALLREKEIQRLTGIQCTDTIDGFTNFVFVNRFGQVQHQGTLNKAIRRIIRDCNDEVLNKEDLKDDTVLLPAFSCHTLRHTFATRMVEADMKPSAVQQILGHTDVSTTLNIYTNLGKDFVAEEISTKIDETIFKIPDKQ